MTEITFPILMRYLQDRHEQDSLLVFAVSKKSTTISISKKKYIITSGNALIVPTAVNSNINILHNSSHTIAIELYGKYVNDLYLTQEISYVNNGLYPVLQAATTLDVFEENADEACKEKSVAAYRLLLELISKSGKEQNSNPLPQFIENAVEIMRAESSYLYSIEEIAESIGVSHPYFSREFKKQMGITPSQFLKSIKIENAKRLLPDHSLSVTVVGQLCGFSDVDYFSKVFKKEVGVSPREYRLAHQSNKSQDTSLSDIAFL